MDDGSLKKVKNTEAHKLCTDTFSKNEVLLKGGNHRIYKPVRDTEKLRKTYAREKEIKSKGKRFNNNSDVA